MINKTCELTIAQRTQAPICRDDKLGLFFFVLALGFTLKESEKTLLKRCGTPIGKISHFYCCVGTLVKEFSCKRVENAKLV